MSKVYVLFYDHDGSGEREEWNTFYTPCEVFERAQENLNSFYTKQLELF